MEWRRVGLGAVFLLLNTGIALAQSGGGQLAAEDGRSPAEARALEAEAERPAGRTLSGLVTGASTNRPIADATVAIRGTDIEALTAADGTFTFTGVSAGELTLVVSREQYNTEEVTVRADQTEVHIELTLEKLEEIVIVGRATRLARKNLANAVSKVSGEEVMQVSSQTFSEALQGKVAGANIQANSGAPGGGIQMRLRGVSTINARSAPLYVVDGVIISDVAISSGLSAVTGSSRGSNASSRQDNQVNRIADLNINDIESIEILKGASAAAIYGAKASNGVVIVTTKRGRARRPGEVVETQVTLTQRLGFYELSNKLGARKFYSVDEAVDVFGEKARDYFEPGRTFDHEEELAGRRDLSSETSVSVSGATGSTDYYASLLARKDAGIICGTGHEKQALRLNLGHSISEKLQVTAFVNLIHSLTRRGITNNDNAGVSHYMVLPFTPSFFDLRRQAGGYPSNPFIGSTANPLQTVALMSDKEDVWRVMGSVNAELEIYSDYEHRLLLTANAGVDRFHQKNDLVFPPELFFEPADGLAGTTLLTTSENMNFNLGINLVYSFEPESEILRSTSSMGFQHEERALNRLYVASRNLNGGKSLVDAGTQINLNEERELVRDQGFYIQEELVFLDDNLTLTAALRGERSSVNGDPNEIFFYPKASAAANLPVLKNYFDMLKVRLAYGETGNQPLYGQKFTPMIVTNNIEGNPGIISGNLAGDPDIRPERQREFEGGVDLMVFAGRVVLELTLYQREITDLLLQRALAPSTGFEDQFFNGGELRNRGFEIALEATPLKEPEGIEWLSRTTFALNRSEIVDLPVPAFITGGFGVSLGAFRIEEGASATQIVGNNGLKEDGTCCRVEKIGDTEPTFRMSFFNRISFMGFGLSFLLDWQQGSHVINLTRFLYDLAQNTPDFVPHGERRLDQFGTKSKVYVEEATFLKLREISLWWDLPEAWAAFIYAKSARLSISARNLFVITPYSGLDPEVSNFGNQPIARNIDVAPYPPSRSYWFSFDVRF